MSRKTEFNGSAVTLTLNLPRVVKIPGGSVGHVLIDATNIYTMRQSGMVTRVHSVACHYVDGRHVIPGDLRWATPDDPTCRHCLASLRFLT
jgi:hypothetical protein